MSRVWSTSAPGLTGALCATLAAALLPTPSVAQEDCTFEPPTRSAQVVGSVTYFGGPHFLCEPDVEIWADTAVSYSDQALIVLTGAVRFLDGVRELTGHNARYYTETGRLVATGDVLVTNQEDGSVIRNGDLVYTRGREGTEDELRVTTAEDGVRPFATLYPAEPDSAEGDSASAEPPRPYSVVGDRLHFRGSSYFNAVGTVEIERDSLFAYADSAQYLQEDGRLFLEGSARVESSANVLVARRIIIGTEREGTDEIRALRDAVLTGDDLELTSPQIVMFLVDGAMERLVAVPLPDTLVTDEERSAMPRPVALAQGVELTGDSLELQAPGEVLERIVAAGSARSVSGARDTLNVEMLPEIARHDWLEGDTIVVTLAPVVRDSTALDVTAEGGGDEKPDYEVERIVAHGRARSLYRLAPADSAAVVGVDPPAIHHVEADEITIIMSDGGVVGMTTMGHTRGMHLEPLRRPPPDAPPDSSSAGDARGGPRAAPNATPGLRGPVSPGRRP